MALGSLDALITLPVGVTITTIFIQRAPAPHLVFWTGWTRIHEHWTPLLVTSEHWKHNAWSNLKVRLDEWLDVCLAGIFFLLFGLTREARASYARAFWRCAGGFGIRRVAANAEDLLPTALPAPRGLRSIPSTELKSVWIFYPIPTLNPDHF